MVENESSFSPFLLLILFFSRSPTSRRTPPSELLKQANFETKTYYSIVMCKVRQVHVASTFSLLMLSPIPVDFKWHYGEAALYVSID